MFGLGTTELLIIGGVLVLLFGAKRLPELGKGLGEGIQNFKKGIRQAGAGEERKALPEDHSDKDDTAGKMA